MTETLPREPRSPRQPLRRNLLAGVLWSALAAGPGGVSPVPAAPLDGPLREVRPVGDALRFFDPKTRGFVETAPSPVEPPLRASDEGAWLDPADWGAYRVVFCLSGPERAWTSEEAAAVWDWVSRGHTLVLCGSSAYALGGSKRHFSEGVAALVGGRKYTNLDGTARVVDTSAGFDPDWGQDTAWFSWKFGLGQLTTADVWIGGDDYALVSRNKVGDGQVFFIAPAPVERAGADPARFAAVLRAVIKTSGVSAEDAAEQPAVACFGRATRDAVAVRRSLDEVLARWMVSGDPLQLTLSKGLYPPSDRYLDGVLQIEAPAPGAGASRSPGRPPEGELHFSLQEAGGGKRFESRAALKDIPAHHLFFSYQLPEGAGRGPFVLRVAWVGTDGVEIGSAQAGFRLREEAPPRDSGRMALQVENPAGVTAEAVPVTLGVPFPRGAWSDGGGLRLVDENGRPIPFQHRTIATWARAGSTRWLLCSFQLDLAGAARTVYLEYGPDVEAAGARESFAERGDGEMSPQFPDVRLDGMRAGADGLFFDPAGGENFRPVLTGRGLLGAFVEREGGRMYEMSPTNGFAVEASGPERTVVRADGWYENAQDADDRFCQFSVRWEFRRRSPWVRVTHTWIYTGDSNEPGNRIASMGWKFATGHRVTDGSFLVEEDGVPEWIEGERLTQLDDEQFVIRAAGRQEKGKFSWARRKLFDALGIPAPAAPVGGEIRGRRAGGIFAGVRDDLVLTIGSPFFWQQFPAGLAFEDDAMVFYAWPRGGAGPRRTGTEVEGREWRLDFAHTGEFLDFALPQAYVEDPVFSRAREKGHHFRKGQADSVNAQGLARTHEYWIHLGAAPGDPATVAGPMAALLDGRLQAHADPRWLWETGAIGDIYPRDPGKFPEEERLYEWSARRPLAVIDHLGIHGKWLWGDYLRAPDPASRTAALYRAFRKGHHGWPYSWIPYARSGDPDFFQMAKAATRYMTDVAFCHYFTPDLDESMGKRAKGFFRAIGWWNRNLVPWAGFQGPTTLMYTDGGEYLWHAYFLTGDERAREVMLRWGAEVKRPDARYGRGPEPPSPRARDNLLQQFTQMFEFTGDPWFMVMARSMGDAMAPGHAAAERSWRTGFRDYHRVMGEGTGYDEFFEAYVRDQADPRKRPWAATYLTQIEPAAYAHAATGDPFFLGRVEGELRHLTGTAYEGEEVPYTGLRAIGEFTQDVGHNGWVLQRVPLALSAVARGPAERVAPIHKGFEQGFWPSEAEASTASDLEPRFIIRKRADEEVLVHATRSPFAFRVESPAGITIHESAGTEAPAESAEEEEENDPAAPTADGPPAGFLIPGEAPAGDYSFVFTGTITSKSLRSRWIDYGFVRLPLADPQTPEVMLLPRGGPMPRAHWFAEYYFMVPEDVETFWMEFPVLPPFREVARRITVRDPDGVVAWDWQRLSQDAAPEASTLRATIEVKPEMRGRLWSVSLPGTSRGFSFDPAIPPVFSATAQKWFRPQAARESD